MSSNPMVTLVSKDGFEFQATLPAVKQSITLRIMLEVLDEEQTTGLPIPIPEVEGETLQKIIEWCEYHCQDSLPELEKKHTPRGNGGKANKLPKWDENFLAVSDRDLLFKLTNAANYLDIPLLLRYAVCTIARKLEHMSTEEMREFLNIQNDFTPAEEASIRVDNAWITRG